MKLIDKTGNVYGRLTVIKRAENDKHGKTRWLCRCECGNETVVFSNNLGRGHTQSCGCLWSEMLAELNRKRRKNLKGKRILNTYGYPLIHDREHPNAAHNGYVFEHTLVMSEHLGRPLNKGESVHHKNGIRDDNRIENLELWAGNHPSGQRVSDLVSWAKELLREYTPSRVPAKGVQYKCWKSTMENKLCQDLETL